MCDVKHSIHSLPHSKGLSSLQSLDDVKNGFISAAGSGNVLHSCGVDSQPGGGRRFHRLRQPPQQTLSDGFLQSGPRAGTVSPHATCYRRSDYFHRFKGQVKLCRKHLFCFTDFKLPWPLHHIWQMKLNARLLLKCCLLLYKNVLWFQKICLFCSSMSYFVTKYDARHWKLPQRHNSCIPLSRLQLFVQFSDDFQMYEWLWRHFIPNYSLCRL